MKRIKAKSKKAFTDYGKKKLFGEKTEDVFMGLTVFFSILMAVALFMLCPYFL